MKAPKELKSLVEGLTARKWERWVGSQDRRPPTLWLFLYMEKLVPVPASFSVCGDSQCLRDCGAETGRAQKALSLGILGVGWGDPVIGDCSGPYTWATRSRWVALSPFLLCQSPLFSCGCHGDHSSPPLPCRGGSESTATGPVGQDLALTPNEARAWACHFPNTVPRREEGQDQGAARGSSAGSCAPGGRPSVMLSQEPEGQLTGAASQKCQGCDYLGCH